MFQKNMSSARNGSLLHSPWTVQSIKRILKNNRMSGWVNECVPGVYEGGTGGEKTKPVMWT